MARPQYSDPATHFQPEFTKIVDGQAMRFLDICVHQFLMSDVEDPDIYAAGPVWAWQQSDPGQWVTEHAVEQPYWIKQIDTYNYGYQFRIMARLSEQDLTFFKLKWGK